MPSPSQRIQCLLRPKTLETVKAVAESQDRSLSRMISDLVEEALAHRGLMDPAGFSRDVVSPETWKAVDEVRTAGKPVHVETYARKENTKSTGTTGESVEDEMALFRQFMEFRKLMKSAE